MGGGEKSRKTEIRRRNDRRAFTSKPKRKQDTFTGLLGLGCTLCLVLCIDSSKHAKLMICGPKTQASFKY